MNLLLDSQIFLWFLADSPRLTTEARQRIQQADKAFISAASIWELSIKAALGKLDMDGIDLVAEISESGFLELPVRAVHAAMVKALPLHHTDPFDRLLVAQSLHEPLHLLTADRILVQYSPLVLIVR